MKQFKAESKKVLDMVINSIYTNKDVFIRELISNASDALDKLYYLSLQNQLGRPFGTFNINIVTDKSEKILIISDNGIGMSKDELDSNLGTIAKSDSEHFKELLKDKEDVNIIGKFGVGFYSAFMVSKQIEVISKRYDSEQAYIWKSNGTDGYEIKETTKEDSGTTIILHLKDDEEETKYSEYLEEHKLRDLIKKYSDYIRYPILMDITKTRSKDEKDENSETEEYVETETLNSMSPLWTRPKSEVTDEQLKTFYQDEFMGYDEPVLSIFSKIEGNLNYTTLLFIPREAPYGYYYKSFERGLKLYSNNVLIMDKCKDLLPECFGFVQGVVSCDLELNVSRETIQHSVALRKITTSLEKKIRSELETILKDKREDYEAFFKSFGLRLKYSIYEEYGIDKHNLKDILIYQSLSDEKYYTLKEYIEKSKEDQKTIYYCKAKTLESAKAIPQSKYLLEQGYDILLFNDDVDEFVFTMNNKYQDHELISITGGKISTKEYTPSDTEKELLIKLKEILKDDVKDIKFSEELADFPAVLTSKGHLTIEMEKVLSANPNNEEQLKAEKVLEINAHHPIKDGLLAVLDNSEKLITNAHVIVNLARLNSGLPIEQTNDFITQLASLLYPAPEEQEN